MPTRGPFNYLVERARGAVGLGGPRSRTSSNDSQLSVGSSSGAGGSESLSSSPSSRSLFSGRVDNYDSSGLKGKSSLSSSASMQDMSAPNKAFFRRGNASSNPLRPGWLSPANEASSRSVPPLKSSPSSPVLSAELSKPSAASDSRDIEEGQRRLPESQAAQVSVDPIHVMTKLTSLHRAQLNFTSRKAFSRSTDDLTAKATSRLSPGAQPPLPLMTRRSTDELRDLFRSRPPTADSASSRRTRTTSLAPSAALDSYPSPSLSMSAPSSRTSRSTSPRTSKPGSPVLFPTSSPQLRPVSPALSTASSDRDRKRDSQTVYCQGLLQRKGDYVPLVRTPASPSASNVLNASSAQSYFSPRTPTATLRSPKGDVDLQRGWKPYHAILKGTKLYLHKVPGDLSLTAKTLFPSTILDEEAAARSPALSTSALSPTLGDDGGKRKQRAFWGTGGTPHPALVVSDAGPGGPRVIGGTLEAFVHEMIFATTTLQREVPQLVIGDAAPEVPATPLDSAEIADAHAQHVRFVDMFLLIWPALPFSSHQFATEFERCASLAIRTSSVSHSEHRVTQDAQHQLERQRRIIENVALHYPQDLRVVDKGQSSPSELRIVLERVTAELVQALPGANELSSILSDSLTRAERFQPKSKPLTEWPQTPAFSHERSSSSTSTSPSKNRKKTSLPQDALPVLQAHVIVAMDPAQFAAQVHSFHLDRLAAITGNNSTARHVLRTASLILATDPARRQTALTSLFSFSASTPHFLSRMVLSTVLSNGAESSANTNDHSKSRADVLTRWVQVGEELKHLGDAAGWMAVATAICSRAVARLEDTWRIMPADVIEIVRSQWTDTLTSLNFIDNHPSTAIAPLVFDSAPGAGRVPFLGSILEDTVSALRECTTASNRASESLFVEPLYAIKDRLEAVASVWSQESLNLSLAPASTEPNPQLQYLFQASSRISHATKQELGAYIPTSIGAEPSAALLAQSSLPVKARSPTEPDVLIPLIMVEILPHISLVDKEKILAQGVLSRKVSSAGLSAAAAHPARDQLSRRNSYPPHVLSHNERGGTLARLRSEIGSGSDTLLRFAGGDLVLRAVSTAVGVQSTASIAPGDDHALSRTSSWIEPRTKRSRMSARTSLASNFAVPTSRRSSSSKRDSLPMSFSRPGSSVVNLTSALEETPVHAAVQAGTLEALLDLLVLGPASLRTPSTDADGVSALCGGRSVSIDMEEYRDCFFSTCRAISSPIVVFDMLRKRYLAAPNASVEFASLTPAQPFPSWSMAPVLEGIFPDSQRVHGIRMSILECLARWIEQHIGDFLEDDELWRTALAFLDAQGSASQEDGDPAVATRARNVLDSLRRGALRPDIGLKESLPIKSSARTDFDGLSADELVDTIDGVAEDLMHQVTGEPCLTLTLRLPFDFSRFGSLTEQDLVRYLSVLEISSAVDPSAWYSTKQKVEDEEAVVLDSYTHTSALKQDSSLWRTMPGSLRRALTAHHLIRRWLIAHIVHPEIKLHQRQQRMLKLVEAIEISRARMSNVVLGGQKEELTTTLDPSLASFVERVIASALVSPESRAFGPAWQGVAAARQANSIETLTGLLRPDLVVTDATATLDVGWLNERLIEIVTQVDSVSDGILINFAKRRWIYHTIRNVKSVSTPQRNIDSSATLSQMERQLAQWGTWSPRLLREAAAGEGNKAVKPVKAFAKLVALQQDKNRRDRALKDIVSRGVKLEQQNRLQREREVAKAMEKSVNSRNKRMTSIFGFGRPMSAPTVNTAAVTPVPSPHSLKALREWKPQSKPYLVLTLSGVEVQAYDNVHRSYVFELSTEDGQRSLFQAPSRDELEQWIIQLRKSGTHIAFRRATFLAQTALAEEPEEVVATGTSTPAKSTSTARTLCIASAAHKVSSTDLRYTVFGVPLWDVVQREGRSIPAFVEAAMTSIEAHGQYIHGVCASDHRLERALTRRDAGLLEVGLYRLSGENKIIAALREGLDNGLEPAAVLANVDVHNITGLLKLFLRELPEPLIPHDLYNAFIAANGISEYDARLYAIRDLVWRMPQPNFRLLRRLVEHLDK